VLPVLQLHGKTASSLARRLRKVTKRLGTVREIDVLRQLIEELRGSARHDERAIARVFAALTEQQGTRRDQLLAKAPMNELRRLATKLAKVETQLADHDARRASTRSWRWAIDARVAHRAGALKSAIESAGSVYLPDRVHNVRIALKKFRYAAEVEHEIAAERMRRQDLLRLKRVQDVLGQLRDRQVLIEHVRQVQASPSSPRDLAGWRGLDALITTIETDCRRLHARYVRDAADLLAVCERVMGRVAETTTRRRVS
jgi:CHAD domain-containing protein